MAKRPQGRAFVLDGVRYVGSPPHSALPRVQFVDMREIGQPMRAMQEAQAAQIGGATSSVAEIVAETVAVEEGITSYARARVSERASRRADPPIFDSMAPVSVSEHDPAATDTEE